MALRISALVVFLAIVLSGFAQNGPTPPKKVALTWTQSTSAGITGNGVYRGTTSGGPYTNLIVTSAPTTTFTDGTVVPGNTYFYVVTAKQSATDESVFSNEAKAVIPLATAGPTGLTASVQ